MDAPDFLGDKETENCTFEPKSLEEKKTETKDEREGKPHDEASDEVELDEELLTMQRIVVEFSRLSEVGKAYMLGKLSRLNHARQAEQA